MAAPRVGVPVPYNCPKATSAFGQYWFEQVIPLTPSLEVLFMKRFAALLVGLSFSAVVHTAAAAGQFDVMQSVQDEQRALDAGVGEVTKSAPTVSLFAFEVQWNVYGKLCIIVPLHLEPQDQSRLGGDPGLGTGPCRY